jgi:cold shock CspA family protein
MRPSFEATELNTFGTGVKIFFSEGYLPENSKITEFREIKDFIFSDQAVISKLEENPRLSLYYVATGTVPANGNFAGALKWLKKELSENYYFEHVDIGILGGKQLIKFCRELENKFEVQLNILDIFPLIVDQKADVKKAYAFTCSAEEFLKVLQKEDGLLRRSLFNDNVRDYLGNKGAINSEIEKTITENPEMFLLCNNGITIVCTDFEQVRGKLVKIENPQIVNGCQTSSSVFNLRDNPNIEKLQLLVRLISTENLEVSNRIVRGTNRQNQVLEEAFEATLPFHQESLEPFFIAFDSGVRIYYERRAKQYNNDPLIRKTQTVNLRILTQAFVGMFLNSPHESHRHEAKLLEEYASDKERRRIFRDQHSPYPYYVCALTWYMFEKYFREERIDGKYKTYRAHLYLIFRLSIGKPLPRPTKSKALDAYCDLLVHYLSEPEFEAQVGRVLEVFDKTQRLWTQHKSRFGIKDNREFTDLLITEANKHFQIGEFEIAQDEQEGPSVLEGNILRIIFRHGLWFGFIRRGLQYENVYFDSRGYSGELRDLLPNTRVTFELGCGIKGDFARNITVLTE